MRALIQRVADASVTVDGRVTGQIGPGLLVLVCAMQGDDASVAEKLAARVAKLRIFRDEGGKMNRSVLDMGGAALFRRTLAESLASLPQNLLYVVEWTAIFYFFGTCLRRKPGLTLTVVIGLPLLVLMLTLFPAVRQAADMAQHANDQQMMLLGVRWMKYLMDIVNFVEHQWPLIQLGTAVASLPLSYLCMRGTPQP